MEKTEAPWRVYLPDLALFCSTAIWGLSFTVMKGILEVYISPLLFIFLRFSISSVLLFFFWRKRLAGLGKDGIKAGIYLGALLFSGFYSQTAGIIFTTASKSAFITGLSSALVPVFLFLHRRRLPDPLVLFALGIAVIGMYFLTDPAGGGLNIGDFLTLICAFAFGAQIYVMGLEASKYDFLALTFVEIATTAILAGLVLPFESMRFEFTGELFGALLFMILLATALALSVQTWAQKKTPAVRAGLIYAAEPVFAYVFAFAILGERFNPSQLTGGAMIIIAIVSTELLPFLIGGREKA